MTTPPDDEPQPRDIALEQPTPEQVEALQAASDDPPGLTDDAAGVADRHGEP